VTMRLESVQQTASPPRSGRPPGALAGAGAAGDNMIVVVNSTNLAGSHTSASGVGAFGRVLLLWYLIAVYSVFSLYVGETKVTCFFAFPAAVVMFFRNLSLVRRAEVAMLGLLLSVALLSVFAGKDADFIGERRESFILFCYSIFMAYALRLELGRATRKDVSWTSGWLALAIATAATLEVLGPLKPVSDAFRVWNNPESFVLYSAEARDMLIAGFVRPSVFTSEPSYAAVGLAVFSFAWFVSTRSQNRLVLFGFVTVLGLFVFRSPITGICIPPAGLVLLNDAYRRYSATRRLKHIYLPLVSIIVALPIVWLALSSIFSARRRSGGLWGDQSMVIRLIAPPRIAGSVLQEYPFMGAGLGGRGAILLQINNVFDDLRLEAAIAGSYGANEIRLPNAFWEHWIYFGLLGGAIAGYAIVRYFRLLGGFNFMPAAVFLALLANTLGAYTTPRFWSFATLVLIATALSNDNVASAEEPPRSALNTNKRSQTTIGRSKRRE
jgi:hypothetical protein